jgi:hypothetical protein
MVVMDYLPNKERVAGGPRGVNANETGRIITLSEEWCAGGGDALRCHHGKPPF